ncbi:sensor histidine kinase [Streptomonospora wellingtoniae]|uniref:histidine kinase n=1 Tax=Streptomonospora wellingtoniae TaxID=3075544 RepID=A0ABU2KN48_9ACTN|nr:sensor domain-containing protein [Streptomonospora sp. DSM 45055]MDT0300694.1 sensor domain-containing protein [Streptomonospora sp. DSM 45055]
MNTERLLGSGRATLFLLASFPTGIAALVLLPLLLLGTVLVPLGAGLFVLPPLLSAVRRCAEWEHRRSLRLLGAAPIPAAPPSPEPRRLLALAGEPATRRALRGLLVHALVGTFAGVVGVMAAVGLPATLLETAVWWGTPERPTFLWFEATDWTSVLLGGVTEAVVYAALFFWGSRVVAGGYARLMDRLLSPSPAEIEAARLSRRVEELSHTRAEALKAHGDELRRIERDLHDGTQARLVELAMRVGVAEQLLSRDPDRAAELLGQIRGRAEEAMTELRDVIRTVYPPILADRGLDGAVAALGARCAVPTRVETGELGVVPASVQAAAYFVVAEALTNTAKHAQASAAAVRVDRAGAALVVEVSDDGVGGAEDALVAAGPDGAARARASGGTGLSGIRRRVAALDGTTSVTSPAGGPTRITVELPCES